MPELAEIKLMSQFINEHRGEYLHTFKSSVTKIKTADLKQPGTFLGSKSRGKELLLEFTINDEKRGLLFTMGMTGNWRHYESKDLRDKHAHFNIQFVDGSVLSMVDARRFARWKEQINFSEDRSPDLTEDNYKDFLFSRHGHKHFEKPVYEVMMDQRYFNGMGNYLRAEVIYRLGINPFQSLNSVLNLCGKDFVEMCKLVPLEAYKMGGGEFQSFKNPNTTSEMNKGAWMQCYGRKNMCKMLDSKNRNFWFDPKWQKHIEN